MSVPFPHGRSRQLLVLCALGALSFFLLRALSGLNTLSTPIVSTEKSIVGSVQSSPTVFTCGFDLWGFDRLLFPDYVEGGRLTVSTLSQQHDILLHVGLDGPCPVSIHNIQNNFSGKVLFVNTEPRTGDDNAEKQRLSDRFYKLGPTQDPTEPRTMSAYFGAIFLVSSPSPQNQARIFHSPTTTTTTTTTSSTVTYPSHLNDSSLRRNAVVFLVSNCLPIRRDAAAQIAQILPIHHGPKCKPKDITIIGNSNNDNNINTNNNTVAIARIPKDDMTGRNDYIHNFQLYSKYKYCLVMENTNTSGYITEKLILAFLGGCIPIYWGTKEVYDIFHPHAFLFYDLDHPEMVLQDLIRLQQKDSAWNEMKEQPILRHGTETIKNYFSFSDTIGDGYLKGKIHEMMKINTAA